MPMVNIELNFYYMHYNDAETFAEWAAEHRKGPVNPSIYVRHAIMSVVFASEALINRVLVEFGYDSHLSEILEKASIPDKWYLAPFICGGRSQVVPFDRSVEPYQGFAELIQIRNWLAHPRVNFFLEGNLDPKSSISDRASGEEYPWLEMLQGKHWPQTGIPKNPFAMDHTHAATALQILDDMTDGLSKKLAGQMHDGWLNLITVKDDAGLHHYKAPVLSIWGGYGGAGAGDE